MNKNLNLKYIPLILAIGTLSTWNTKNMHAAQEAQQESKNTPTDQKKRPKYLILGGGIGTGSINTFPLEKKGLTKTPEEVAEILKDCFYTEKSDDLLSKIDQAIYYVKHREPSLFQEFLERSVSIAATLIREFHERKIFFGDYIKLDCADIEQRMDNLVYNKSFFFDVNFALLDGILHQRFCEKIKECDYEQCEAFLSAFLDPKEKLNKEKFDQLKRDLALKKDLATSPRSRYDYILYDFGVTHHVWPFSDFLHQKVTNPPDIINWEKRQPAPDQGSKPIPRSFKRINSLKEFLKGQALKDYILNDFRESGCIVNMKKHGKNLQDLFSSPEAKVCIPFSNVKGWISSRYLSNKPHIQSSEEVVAIYNASEKVAEELIKDSSIFPPESHLSIGGESYINIALQVQDDSKQTISL